MRETHQIIIDQTLCIGCGLCKSDCPAYNIDIKDQKAQLYSQACIMCGHCVAICPKAAISMTGFEETPEAIKNNEKLDSELVLQALKTRRSIRQFTKQRIDEQLVKQSIEAGRLTPSAGNAQDVSYLVLNKQLHECEQIAVTFFQRLLSVMKLVNPIAKRTVIDDHFFFKGAPVAILIISPNKINGALAAANMEMMAESYGLGVLYSGFFSMAVNHSHALRKQLGIKRKDHVVTTLVLGYPSVTYQRTAPKEAAQIIWR